MILHFRVGSVCESRARPTHVAIHSRSCQSLGPGRAHCFGWFCTAQPSKAV
ncbi:unnamed protein product [Staurois parvus]|uniref:Uncharacterized protein n=1 Tax=Staurois parvus TaxID=386267 RepID=A0ABN9D435_9NEOB|nr:unnamed protein product [Staurois parvus]